jgi:hypothetical protein
MEPPPTRRKRRRQAEGLSDGVRRCRARGEAGELRCPSPRALVWAGSEHRQKTGPDFGGQIFKWFGGRTSRPKPSPQLPQRRNLGFCDGARGQDCVFRLRWTIILAEQRFVESTLHFVLEPGESVFRRRPRSGRPVGNAKFGANPHKARRAHDGWRANHERADASEELAPRDE